MNLTDRLNFSSAGHLIEAEQIAVPGEAPYKVRLKHHYVKKEVPSSVEIWQNPDKTGSFLTEESYTGSVSANGYFQVDYGGQEDGDVKYCNTLLFHSGQAGTTWYVWYRSQGDVVDAESFNSKADKVPGATAGNLASLDATGNLQDSGKSAANFVNIISSDLTLNVPSEYATIQDALNYLSDKFIPDDVTVTIRVAAGIHTHTSQITVKHPCGKQIQIVGADPITTTISSVGTVSGSAGNWSVPITVADATGIQVGQYAIVRNTTGTDDHYALRGIWEITDVSGDTITIKNTHRKDTFPTFTCTDGDVVVLTTILKFNDCHGITVDGAILGYLNNVAVVSNGASGYSGIIALGDTSNYSIRGAIRCGDNVGVNGFGSVGYYAALAGSIHAPSTVASGNGSYGYYATLAGSIHAGYSIASGNGSTGYYASLAGSIHAGYSIASGNGSVGYYAAYSGSIHAGYSIASGNGTGYYAVYSGSIAAFSSTASGNGTDYKAIKMGYIYCYDYVGSPTFSPALNTEGNYNSIITT